MDFKVLGRLLKMLFRDYPVKMTIASVCVIVGALIDITPAAYIETITSYIEEGLVVGWDGVSAKIFSAILTMILLFTLNVILVATLQQLMAGITQGFLHKTRVRMFSKMQSLPVSYFDRNSRGDIMSRFTNDTDTLRQVISSIPPANAVRT